MELAWRAGLFASVVLPCFFDHRRKNGPGRQRRARTFDDEIAGVLSVAQRDLDDALAGLDGIQAVQARRDSRRPGLRTLLRGAPCGYASLARV